MLTRIHLITLFGVISMFAITPSNTIAHPAPPQKAFNIFK